DHIIVGVVIWGLLFAVYDGFATRPAPWLKGLIFGAFAWLVMMLAFMPLAGAGFFGSKIDVASRMGLLGLHLIFGLTLGAAYGLLGETFPVRAPVVMAAAPELSEAERLRFSSPDYSFNDDLPTSSPSARTVLTFF